MHKRMQLFRKEVGDSYGESDNSGILIAKGS